MYKQVLTILSLLLAIGNYAQVTIHGKVVDEDGELPGAFIKASEGIATVTDLFGNFSITHDTIDSISVEFYGYYSKVISLDSIDISQVLLVELKQDTFEQEMILLICDQFGIPTNLITEITIISDQRSSSTVTQLNRPAELSVAGTADILSNAPGIFADASTGEVFSRVFSRGVTLSAEDDIGWFYNCLLYTSPSPRDKRQSRMPSSA